MVRLQWVQILALSFAKRCGFEPVTKYFEPQAPHLGEQCLLPSRKDIKEGDISEMCSQEAGIGLLFYHSQLLVCFIFM